MPRNDRSLERLYGAPVRRPSLTAGPALAIWAIGLLCAAALSALLSVVSFTAAITDDAATVQLRAWGVLGPTEQWSALHADDATATAGCLLTDRELVRWTDRSPEARLPLAGAVVSIGAEGMEVEAAGQRIACPSDPGGDLRTFAALTKARTQIRARWHPGPDPRVSHLYD